MVSKLEGFSTYASYIAALSSVDSRFEWLSHFWSHDPKPASPCDTILRVIDNENGLLRERSMPVEKITKCPKSTSVRLVILSYTETWSIDRHVLDKVAMALDLSPYFLWQHFDHEDIDLENHAPSNRRRSMGPSIEPCAPSHTPSLEIGVTGSLQLSAILVAPKSKQTAPIRISAPLILMNIVPALIVISICTYSQFGRLRCHSPCSIYARSSQLRFFVSTDHTTPKWILQGYGIAHYL